MFVLRHERPDDISGIREVNEAAFETEDRFSGINIFRKTGAIIATFFLIGIVGTFIISSLRIYIPRTAWYWLYAKIFLSLTSTVIVFILLLNWKKGINIGKRPWFVSIHPFLFTIILIVVFVVPLLWAYFLKPRIGRGIDVLMNVENMVLFILFLWWFDGFNLKIPALIAGIAAYKLYMFIGSYLGGIFIALKSRPDKALEAAFSLSHLNIKYLYRDLIRYQAEYVIGAFVLYLLLSFLVKTFRKRGLFKYSIQTQ